MSARQGVEVGMGGGSRVGGGGAELRMKGWPVARHSNLCVSKQDSHIYREDAGEQNKEEGSPNVTLKPSYWIAVLVYDPNSRPKAVSFSAAIVHDKAVAHPQQEL